MTCSIDGCDRPKMSRGWCGAHYRRWHRYGDPLGLAVRKTYAELGEDKTCLTCSRTLDITQFPQGWSPCRDCRSRSHYTAGRACDGCDTPVTNGSKTGLCRSCFGASRRASAVHKRLTGRSDGYVVLTGYFGHPNARTRGHILEHVKVMADVLGRPLVAGENVHHINGVRDDNRPENLELWSTRQPYGQRVVDKVAWAKEILARYEPSALSVAMEEAA